MSRNKDAAVALASGLIFAIGLGLAGMTQPAKVVGFLDVTGDWDPSLAFVMMGAIGVHLLAYRLGVPRMQAPAFRPRFGIPTRRDVDLRLVGGAALFGAGWGIGGFCPGPAMVSITGGMSAAWIFVVAMLVGMALFQFVDTVWLRSKTASQGAPASKVELPPSADAYRGGAQARIVH